MSHYVLLHVKNHGSFQVSLNDEVKAKEFLKSMPLCFVVSIPLLPLFSG